MTSHEWTYGALSASAGPLGHVGYTVGVSWQDKRALRLSAAHGRLSLLWIWGRRAGGRIEAGE